jgi:hypothetical protein
MRRLEFLERWRNNGEREGISRQKEKPPEGGFISLSAIYLQNARETASRDSRRTPGVRFYIPSGLAAFVVSAGVMYFCGSALKVSMSSADVK